MKSAILLSVTVLLAATCARAEPNVLMSLGSQVLDPEPFVIDMGSIKKTSPNHASVAYWALYHPLEEKAAAYVYGVRKFDCETGEWSVAAMVRRKLDGSPPMDLGEMAALLHQDGVQQPLQTAFGRALFDAACKSVSPAELPDSPVLQQAKVLFNRATKLK